MYMLMVIKKMVSGIISLGLVAASGYMMFLNQKIVQQNDAIEKISEITQEKQNDNTVLSYQPETEVQSLLGFATTEEATTETGNINILGVGLS